MISKEEIIKAWVAIRKIDCSITDEVLDFMKNASIEALKQKSCNTCKHYDTERPRSHPNYAECNNRNSPLSYVEVNYSFCCNMYIKK